MIDLAFFSKENENPYFHFVIITTINIIMWISLLGFLWQVLQSLSPLALHSCGREQMFVFWDTLLTICIAIIEVTISIKGNKCHPQEKHTVPKINSWFWFRLRLRFCLLPRPCMATTSLSLFSPRPHAMKIFHPPCPSDNSLWRTVNSAKKLLLSSRSEMLNLSIILLLSHHVTNIHLPNNTMMTDQNGLPTQWTADYWELQHEENLKKGK